jgi:hypothetical protein
MNKINKTAERSIIIIVLALVGFGWYSRLISIPVALILTLFSLVFLIINIAQPKTKRDKFIIIVSLITLLTCFTVVELKYLSMKKGIAVATEVTSTAQKECCEKGICPQAILGWKSQDNGKYYDSGHQDAYTFWYIIHYKTSDDHKRFSLKMRYGLDNFDYFYGGVDNCGK